MNIARKTPELLSPAGSLKSMQYAFAYGADAVYAGLPRYSLRARNNSFRKDNIGAAIQSAHAQGKKFYMAANLLPHNPKVKTFIADMEPVMAMKPDALIMSDPGLIMMTREKWPEMPIHLSVQMNTVNFASVKFWQKQGISRIILSRELSLDEIAEIRQLCPDVELEVFVHGALCIAYSGRCLLSGYFNHRDSNQGVCTNACRWEYKTLAADEKEDAQPSHVIASHVIARGSIAQGNIGGCATSSCGAPRHPEADGMYYLEEKTRPGEMMPVFEDEHGTYIMNSKDLRAIEHVQRLVDMGIDCLKIEGRTKSHYYVARTAQAYRQAIDCAVQGQALPSRLFGALESLSNRGYTDGFYQRHHSEEHQNYISGSSKSDLQEFVGEALAPARDGWIEIDVKNRFQRGDRIEFILPDGNNITTTIDQIRDVEGNSVNIAPGNGHRVFIPYAGPVMPYVLVGRFV